MTDEERVLNALMRAWGVIANVSEGNWEKQTQEWQEAAARWRDEEFHPLLDALPIKELEAP